MKVHGVAFGAAFAAGVIVACDSFSESGPPPGDAGSLVDVTTDAADGADAAAADGATNPPFVRYCNRQDAGEWNACDDFEDGVLLDPPWYPEVQRQVVPDSVVALYEPAGDGMMRVSMPTTNAVSAAFLFHEIGTPSKAEVTFGITVQVTGFAPESDYVEIAALHVASDTGAGIAWDKGSFKLFVKGRPAVPISGSGTMRRRIVVTAAATSLVARNGTGEKLAELAIDAGTLPTSGLRLGLGVYYTPKCAAGTVDIDDVVISY